MAVQEEMVFSFGVVSLPSTPLHILTHEGPYFVVLHLCFLQNISSPFLSYEINSSPKQKHWIKESDNDRFKSETFIF
jgi:hypothetical protein